jgi:Polyketide cyclase / dehydrase and lipid transport
MTITQRACRALLIALILFSGGVHLVRLGLYGLTLFALIPLVLGGLVTWVVLPRSLPVAAATGALGAGAASGLLFLVGVEGVVCIFMALPFVMALGALGGLLAYGMYPSRVGARGLAAFLLLPSASLTWDATAIPPVFAVRTSIEIAAPAEKVWKHVVTFSQLPEPEEWLFRTGLAYPIRARIEGSGAGALRYCEFSTGAFVEPIEVWDAPHLLRFSVTKNPPPMQEWSPYGAIRPEHLREYLVSRRGQFELTSLPDGKTLLKGTTWYQHGLWPAWYWRWWSDAIIHRIHLRVLNHIRALAEKETTQ